MSLRHTTVNASKSLSDSRRLFYDMTPAGPGPSTQIALVTILLIYNNYLCWHLYRHEYCAVFCIWTLVREVR